MHVLSARSVKRGISLWGAQKPYTTEPSGQFRSVPRQSMDYPFRPMLTMESRVEFHGVIPLSRFNALRDSAMEFHVIPPWNHVKFHTFPPFLTNFKPTFVSFLSATVCVQVHVWLNKTMKFHACTTQES